MKDKGKKKDKQRALRKYDLEIVEARRRRLLSSQGEIRRKPKTKPRSL